MTCGNERFQSEESLRAAYREQKQEKRIVLARIKSEKASAENADSFSESERSVALIRRSVFHALSVACAFHSAAISLARRANFIEKSLVPKNKAFFGKVRRFRSIQHFRGWIRTNVM